MRIFEQKLCEISESLIGKKFDKCIRPKLVMREGHFIVCSVMNLTRTDLIVCNLSLKDLREGLSSGTWAAIERFIRMTFDWKKVIPDDVTKEKKP